MKVKVCFLFCFLLSALSGFSQKAFTSVQDGNWNDGSTWDLSAGAGGTEGVDFPSASDIVTINDYVIIDATNSGSDFVFTGELTITEDDTLECQIGSATTGFILQGNGIMRNFGSFFTLDASEEPDENAHIPKEFVCQGNSIFIGGLNSFAFIADDWELNENGQVFLDNLLCYAVSDDVNFESSTCNMYGAGNIRIGGDGLNSTVNFNGGSTAAQLDDDITIWRNVSANACSGTTVTTGTNPEILPPFALEDEYTTTINTAQDQYVLTQGNDDFSPVEDDTLTLISVGNNASINDGNTSLGGTVSINNNGTPTDPTDDYIDYTPPAATTGTDTYSYIINNKAGGADTALVTVTIANSIVDKDGDGIDNATDVDDDNDGILDVDECGEQTQTTVFTYTGADQTYNVPNNTTEITAKIWGAGGRGDEESGRGTGGAGGYTEITINVSDLTSTSLIVTVGEGGNSSTGSVTYGNGGAGLSGGGRNYGAGGGMSAISYTTLSNPGVLSDADLLAIAGGGGTAAAFTNAGSQAGEGGGTNGQDGVTTDGGGEGQGGTQVAGGASTSGNAGSFLLGGDAVTNGGAGGGGYYGGGSGFGAGPSLSDPEGVGGGGSGYVDPAATSSTTTAGTGQTPPNTGDADYLAGVGQGGNSGGVNGGNGLVVITAIIDSCDTDGDGVINSCDLDSDNDGIPDIVEAGGEDTNGDGKVDVDTDTDGDGWANTFDSDNGGTALTDPDTDGDGIQNKNDIDADGDGIIDVIEAQASGTITTPSGLDSDGDGIDDNFDPDNGNSLTVPFNTDGTDNPDYTDTDSDNDTDLDALEGYDTDNDGVANTSAAGTDTDNDGLDDNYDNVSGANSTTNVTNGGQTSASFPNLDIPSTSEADWREIEDKDGDGVANKIDDDDDNDGILDIDECGGLNQTNTFTYTGSDQTYNVPVNAFQLTAKIWGAGGRGDTEDDRGTGGAGGYTEITIDASALTSNTLVVTVGEGGNSSTGSATYGNGGAGLSGGGRNFGSGGGMSALSYTTLSNPGVLSDADLVAIAGGGGTAAAFTNAGSQAGEGGGTSGQVASTTDAGGEGGGGTQASGGASSGGNPGSFLQGGDAVTNGGAGGGGYYGGGSGWIVGSNEGIGGGGSGYVTPAASSSTTTAGTGQTPPNTGDADYVAGVGVGGDNGGVNGGNGLVVIEAFISNCDSDGDGVINACDLDSDNDGITDIIEAGGVDSDNDGRVDDNTDSDGDGYADTFDSDNGGAALSNPDTDGDGINNFRDVDSDSDGITDNLEGQTTAAFQAPTDTDTDGDGWDDRYDSDNGGTAITLSNNEGAGEPDYLDNDSDGDGQWDYIEGFDDDGDLFALNDLLTRANNYETAAANPLHYVNSDDADADGVPDWGEDDDADGVLNYLDPDSGFYFDMDGDGIINLFDPDNNGVSSITPDLDGDGEYDFRDTDDEIAGLPVDLVEFTAVVFENQVKLSWTTLSEINNDYFLVERSRDGETFETVLRKQGHGNSTIERTYQGYDQEPYIGINYYRLSQFDYDGTVEQFDDQIKVVEFSGSSLGRILLYPNPTRDKLYLKMEGISTGTYQIEIINASGKLLLTKELTVEEDESTYREELLRGNTFSKGVYLLRVQNGKESEEFRFLIQ
ncbi:MAG: glycine-rich protein [Vicingaceae bacterium]